MNHSVKRHRQALHQTQHQYYLNISVEAAKLSDWRIESNRNCFCPNWNALLDSGQTALRTGVCVESRTRGLTADPRLHLPADAVADLWSESAAD